MAHNPSRFAAGAPPPGSGGDDSSDDDPDGVPADLYTGGSSDDDDSSDSGPTGGGANESTGSTSPSSGGSGDSGGIDPSDTPAAGTIDDDSDSGGGEPRDTSGAAGRGPSDSDDGGSGGGVDDSGDDGPDGVPADLYTGGSSSDGGDPTDDSGLDGGSGGSDPGGNTDGSGSSMPGSGSDPGGDDGINDQRGGTIEGPGGAAPPAQGLEQETPDGESFTPEEREITNQAQDFEERVLEENPGLDDEDIRIVRGDDGEVLETELTSVGQAEQAREFKQEVLERNPGLEADEVEVVPSEDGTVRARITEDAQQDLDSATPSQTPRSRSQAQGDLAEPIEETSENENIEGGDARLFAAAREQERGLQQEIDFSFGLGDPDEDEVERAFRENVEEPTEEFFIDAAGDLPVEDADALENRTERSINPGSSAAATTSSGFVDRASREFITTGAATAGQLPSQIPETAESAAGFVRDVGLILGNAPPSETRAAAQARNRQRVNRLVSAASETATGVRNDPAEAAGLYAQLGLAVGAGTATGRAIRGASGGRLSGSDLTGRVLEGSGRNVRRLLDDDRAQGQITITRERTRSEDGDADADDVPDEDLRETADLDEFEQEVERIEQAEPDADLREAETEDARFEDQDADADTETVPDEDLRETTGDTDTSTVSIGTPDRATDAPSRALAGAREADARASELLGRQARRGRQRGASVDAQTATTAALLAAQSQGQQQQPATDQAVGLGVLADATADQQLGDLLTGTTTQQQTTTTTTTTTDTATQTDVDTNLDLNIDTTARTDTDTRTDTETRTDTDTRSDTDRRSDTDSTPRRTPDSENTASDDSGSDRSASTAVMGGRSGSGDDVIAAGWLNETVVAIATQAGGTARSLPDEAQAEAAEGTAETFGEFPTLEQVRGSPETQERIEDVQMLLSGGSDDSADEFEDVSGTDSDESGDFEEFVTVGGDDQDGGGLL